MLSKESSGVARRWLIIAAIGWFGLGLFVTGAVLFSKKHRSVVPAYQLGATQWIEGKPLYNGLGEGFIYFPQSAILFTPWANLPEAWREISWRWTGIAIYVVGLFQLGRLLFPNQSWTAFGRASLCAVPMSYCAIRNGQATMMLTGIMLLAVTQMGASHWTRSAAWMVLGLAVKPLMMVQLLLAGATQSRMRIRLAIGLVVFAFVPFLTQHFAYVVEQYQAAVLMLRDVDRVGHTTQLWCQIFGLLHVMGISLGENNERLLQLTAAVVTLGLCVWSMRLPRERQAFYLFAFSATYLMLFNSRTEMNTYAMLGPAVGMVAVQAFFEGRTKLWWTMAFVAIAATANYELGKLIIPGVEQVWMAPVGGIVFAVSLATLLVQEVRQLKQSLATEKDEEISIAHAA